MLTRAQILLVECRVEQEKWDRRFGFMYKSISISGAKSYIAIFSTTKCKSKAPLVELYQNFWLLCYNAQPKMAMHGSSKVKKKKKILFLGSHYFNYFTDFFSFFLSLL